VRTLILVGKPLVCLELIISELVGWHRDDVLLDKDARLALTLASPAISDGDSIGDAIRACQQNNAPSVYPHHRTAAGILLPGKLDPKRHLGYNSAGELFHSLFKVGVTISFFATSVLWP
jgi:hypothetical protein